MSLRGMYVCIYLSYQQPPFCSPPSPLIVSLPLPSPQDVIENFNRTVNSWVFRHVYKRLQPLQSRLISQSVSMVFLILWHGLHVGYLINFSLEVPAILAEQKVCRVRGGVGRGG